MESFIVTMLNARRAFIACTLMLRICIITQLITFVCPSGWGWKVMDLVSLVSIMDQRLDQNIVRNLLDLLETMIFSNPK
jgi:hypothetical protein